MVTPCYITEEEEKKKQVTVWNWGEQEASPQELREHSISHSKGTACAKTWEERAKHVEKWKASMVNVQEEPVSEEEATRQPTGHSHLSRASILNRVDIDGV